MSKTKKKNLMIPIFMLVLASCGIRMDKQLDIACTNRAENIAVTHLTKAIFEEQGYEVRLHNADIASLFGSLSCRKVDVLMSTRLADAEADYMKQYANEIEMIGTAELPIIVWKGFEQKHLFATALLANITLTDNDITSLTAAMDEAATTGDEVARKWVTEHRMLIENWIPYKTIFPVYPPYPYWK